MGLIRHALRVRWRNGWLSSLWLAVLIGAVGAFVLAAAASARRVEGAYSNFTAEVRPPDLAVIPACAESSGTGCDEPAEGDPLAGAQVVRDLRQLAVVDDARLVESLLPYLVDSQMQPLLGDAEDPYGCSDRDRAVNALPLGSGGPADQSVPFRLDGRLPAAGTAGAVLANATAEREKLEQGDVIVLAGWCADGDPVLLPTPVDLTVTGVAVGPLDIEPPGVGLAIEPIWLDRTVFDQLTRNGAEVQPNAVVWIDQQARPEAVAAALAGYFVVIDFADRADTFDSVLATDARLLWLLAAVGAVTGVLMLAPLIAGHVRANSANVATLRALGTSRAQIAAQELAAVTVLGVTGSVMAALAMPPVSAAMPRGFASAIHPDRELWIDAEVTIIGAVGLVVIVVALAVLPALNIGNSRRLTPGGAAASRRARPVAHSLLRPSLQSGVQAAVGMPAGMRVSSPWARLVSITLAAATCVASLTYLAGLDRLQDDSSLVGWDWDAMVSFDPEFAADVPSIIDDLRGVGGVEQVSTGTFYPPAMLLATESDVTVWPWSFDTGVGAVGPVMVSGRSPAAPHEVAIDDLFAHESGLSIGDTVTFGRRSLASQIDESLREQAAFEGFDLAFDPPDDPLVTGEFEVTGRTVLPLQRSQQTSQAAFTLRGLADLLEPDSDEIAAASDWVPSGLPANLRGIVSEHLSNVDIEDRVVYVRGPGEPEQLQPLVDAAVGDAGSVLAPGNADVLSLIVGLNLIRTDRVPSALGKVAIAASALMLISLLVIALRARHRELAIMRTLGLTNAGVRWSIAAHATTTVIVPLIVAVPAGVAIGRWAWSAYAIDLDVVPRPVTPWSMIVIAALAAVVAANVVAMVAGRSLTRSALSTETRTG